MSKPDFITFPARPNSSGTKVELMPPALMPTMWSAKANGYRLLLHTPTGTAFNRQGELLSSAGDFTEAIESLKGCPFEWLDCEALSRRHKLNQGTLLIIDYVSAESAIDRYNNLKKVFKVMSMGRPQRESVLLIPQFLLVGDQIKKMWEKLKRVNRELGADFWEGMVGKWSSSPYPIQKSRPDMKSPGWTKIRFLS